MGMDMGAVVMIITEKRRHIRDIRYNRWRGGLCRFFRFLCFCWWFSSDSTCKVPLEFKEVLGDTVVAALSYYSPLVRVEAVLTLRALVEVDPSSIGGLISYAMTMLNTARENVSFEKAEEHSFRTHILQME